MFTVFFTFVGCQQQDSVSKSDYDTTLLLGIAAASNHATGSETNIDIYGSWDQFGCSAGNCPTNAEPGAKIFIRKEGDYSFLYQQNPPTCWSTNYNQSGTDYCHYTQGQQMTDNFYPAHYKILEYDNAKGELYYQDVNNTARYSAFVWTSYNGKKYTCDLFSSDTSLSNAKKTFAYKKQTNMIFSTDPTRDGCNSPYAWYLWNRLEL